ncbi:hypothetical protein HU200_013976 [Digitaria exilis]|uniref:Large ribosomal subunit protein uL2 C-terminal domain-containing protein n=1 Tax=Digitaria exilis TaxID=1010633 RepID=A0A835KKK8_9POAL|nr:hypothetical protein HU200_013976 [Digitaria exilis]
MGTWVHDIECHPGQGAKLARAAGTYAKIIKLRKAGQSRWLGRRPIVRGVAMNPVDHPHGGGEGARKEVDLRCHLGESPPKQDFGQ